MANKSKNNKLIFGICAAVIVVIVAIVAVILVNKNSGPSDAYFVSDGTKYVLNMSADEMAFDDQEYAPTEVHLVYTYSEDKITGLKTYYEYESAEKAKAAYDYISSNDADLYKSISVDGKYLILESKEEEYQDITPEDVKQQIEFMELLRTMNIDSEEEEEDVETEDDSEVVDELTTLEESETEESEE